MKKLDSVVDVKLMQRLVNKTEPMVFLILVFIVFC